MALLSSARPTTVDFDIIHPHTKQPLDITIKLVGLDSTPWFNTRIWILKKTSEIDSQVALMTKKEEAEVAAATTEEEKAAITTKWNNAKTDFRAKETVNMQAQAISNLIVGWDEKYNPNFKDLDTVNGTGAYSPELVFRIISDHEYDWLRLAIDTFVTEKSNFFMKA